MPVSSQKFRMFVAASLAGVMLLVAGCASAPIAPTASLGDAKSAIRAAEKEGARQYAVAELDQAQQKLIMADRAVVEEKMLLAERFAKESIVTAELAAARSEAIKAEAINEEMRRSATALAEEMRRAGDQQ